LTRSYVCLAYHRVAGELRPGEERYDVAPRRFARNATLLRLMRWRPLDVAEIAAVHRGTAVLPRRRFVLTLDDGYADAVAAATAHADLRPHLYVPTAEVADRPAWAGGAALAGWDDLAAATAAGARVGVHGRVHRPLTGLPPARVADELTQALTELRGHLPEAVPMLAYPNGRHDATVREAAIAGGYLAAWTTMTGRNGPGADPYCLRRVSVKDWDGPLSFMWKVVSGQNVPPLLEVVTRSWWRRRAGRRGVRRAVDPT
jgi:peptidoglycan/xylan/chitin deacetylase (PgdA/CDA1 family)